MPSTFSEPLPTDTLRPALALAGLYALALFLFHVAANVYQAHIGYGYFRDEFYYLICGRRLAWGFVDHGPLVALQARLAETLFGHSLLGLRTPAALFGSARVFLTGLLAWSLGGRRPAQSLSMLGVALAPEYLALDGFLSMNCAESTFWMLCLLALVLMLRGYSQRLWLLFGLAGGLGLLNKPSMTFFLLALLAALLVTPQRRLLRTPWAAAGIALLLALVAPYLHWQISNGWPTLDFLHGSRTVFKANVLSAIPFFLTQISELEPLSAFLWIPGLVWLLRRQPWRFLGLTATFFLVGMFLLHSKDYYVMPVYPVLFAAGGLAWEQRFAARKLVQQNRAFAFPVFMAALTLVAIAVLPMSTPLLRPTAWLTYAHATHQFNAGTTAERYSAAPLPQFYSDRFGWQEEVDQVQRIFASLTPDQQRRTAIFTDNYGEAAALDFLGHGLPPALSGHNNYWLWGPHHQTGEILIRITPDAPATLQPFYSDIRLAGRMDNPWSMTHEHKNIYLLQNPTPQTNLLILWPHEKHYD